jgi:Flp pilus assembly protein TadB
MLHYLMHAGEYPWQDQLLYGGGIVAAILLLFLFFWWRKGAARPRQGDFAALVQRPSIAEALTEQQQSPLADAAEAWQQTQTALSTVKSGVERTLALVWTLLSGLMCAICSLFVLMDLVKFPAMNWGQLAFYSALGGVSAWFTRRQWRDFRGLK